MMKMTKSCSKSSHAVVASYPQCIMVHSMIGKSSEFLVSGSADFIPNTNKTPTVLTTNNAASHPAHDCKQASMVAKVSGGSWALLGWSLSGARPPMMDGQRLFRNVTHAWMNGSYDGEETTTKINGF